MSLKNNLHNIAEYVELFELLRNILFYDVVNKERSMAKNSIYMSSIQPIMPNVAFMLSMIIFIQQRELKAVSLFNHKILKYF